MFKDKTVPKLDLLTPQQSLFVGYYFESGNATDAYIKAGYRVKDRNVAKSAASAMLRRLSLHQLLNQGGFSNEELLHKLSNLLNDENPSIRMRAIELTFKLKLFVYNTYLLNPHDRNKQFYTDPNPSARPLDPITKLGFSMEKYFGPNTVSNRTRFRDVSTEKFQEVENNAEEESKNSEVIPKPRALDSIRLENK